MAENSPFMTGGIAGDAEGDKRVFRGSDGQFQSVGNARAEMDADLSSRPQVETADASQDVAEPITAEASQDAVEPVTEAKPGAESVGAERAERAGKWIVAKYEGAKAKFGKAAGFLKRLGHGILGADQAVKDVGAEAVAGGKAAYAGAKEAVGGAATAVAEKGKEAYAHASEAVKNKAKAAGERMQGAWERAGKFKDGVLAEGARKIDSAMDKGREFRKGVIAQINNAERAARIGVLEARDFRAEKDQQRQEDVIARATKRLGEIQTERGAIRDEIDTIRAGGTSRGSQTAPAAA